MTSPPADRHGSVRSPAVPWRALHEEALAIRRALGGGRGVACSFLHLGWLARAQGDAAAARALLGESLEIVRELGDKWGVVDRLDLLVKPALTEGKAGRGSASPSAT